MVIYPLTLEPTEEAFRNSIVVAVTFAAHAAEHTMLFENILVIG